MKCSAAVLHVAAGEGIAVALLQIYAVCPRDWIAVGRWAVDVQPHKSAGVEPVGRGRVCDLMANAVDRDLKSADVVVVERAAGVVACAIKRHARLIRIAEQIQTLEIHLLRAIGRECLCTGVVAAVVLMTTLSR